MISKLKIGLSLLLSFAAVAAFAGNGERYVAFFKELGIEGSAQWTKRFYDDPVLRRFAVQHDTYSARDYVSKIVETELNSLKEELKKGTEIEINRGVGLSEYLFRNNLDKATQIKLNETISRAALQSPEPFRLVDPDAFRRITEGTVFNPSLEAAAPKLRVNYLKLGFGNGEDNPCMRELYRKHLVSIAQAPGRFPEDALLMLEDLPPRFTEKLALEMGQALSATWKKNSQNDAFKAAVNSALEKLPLKEHIFYGRLMKSYDYSTAHDLYDNLFQPLKKTLEPGKLTPPADPFETWFRRAESKIPTAETAFDQAVKQLTFDRLKTLGEPGAKKIGPWAFAKLLANEPTATRPYMKRYLKFDLIPFLTQVDETSSVQAISSLNEHSSAAVSEILMETAKTPELNSLISAAIEKNLERHGSLKFYNSTVESLARLYPPESFEALRLPFVSAPNVESIKAYLGPEEFKRKSSQYLREVSRVGSRFEKDFLLNANLANLVNETRVTQMMWSPLDPVDRDLLHYLGQALPGVPNFHKSLKSYRELYANIAPAFIASKQGNEKAVKSLNEQFEKLFEAEPTDFAEKKEFKLLKDKCQHTFATYKSQEPLRWKMAPETYDHPANLADFPECHQSSNLKKMIPTLFQHHPIQEN